MTVLAISTLFFHPPFGWILVIIALSIAVARVAIGIHYLGDIITGLCIGTIVAWSGTILPLYISN